MSVWDLTQHNYEEVRQAVIDILLGRANSGNIPRQFTDVVMKVGFVFGRASLRQVSLLTPPTRRCCTQETANWCATSSGICFDRA